MAEVEGFARAVPAFKDGEVWSGEIETELFGSPLLHDGLLLTVTNLGTQVCQRDVSGSLQTFTVFGADGSRIFSTADCFPGTGSEVRELTPGQQLQYTIKWSGTTSAPGCTGERVAIPAGDYTVIGQLGGLSSSPAPFTVTG